MDELRAGCPWDKEQTLDSLRHLTIEETFELSDAILRADYDELEGELGDLLLHIVFYVKILNEQSRTDMNKMINRLCDKLIRRHPHIYGDVNVNNAEEVKQNWEQIKKAEKSSDKSVLSGVPASMPALVKALRMQDKAAQVGFDWPSKDEVWDKVQEELEEFKMADSLAKQEEEFGDLLFSLVNYARWLDINPDDALEKTNLKFRKRFEHIESKAKEAGRPLSDINLAQMEQWWQEAK